VASARFDNLDFGFFVPKNFLVSIPSAAHS
jgi:hypothetical protein